MNDIKKFLENAKELEQKLNYTFQNKDLLELAFTHRSFVNENKKKELPSPEGEGLPLLYNLEGGSNPPPKNNDLNYPALKDRVLPLDKTDTIEHNERLEFLGDSVLGVIITEFLYKNLPDTPEGDLSPLRSRIVNASACTEYVQQLDVENYILLGKGEKMNNRRSKDSILADLFEAIIGAIYLDGNLQAAKEFFFHHFENKILDILHQPSSNWKAKLQDYSQKKYQEPPEYKIITETGPDHNKTFVISVFVNKQQMGQGSGQSKKEAEQTAAAAALNEIC